MKCDCTETKCPKPTCGCKRTVIGIEELPNDVATLKFNIDGVSTWYDYTTMITETQTDTSISVDSIKRVLKYMAERHTDTISAKELGSILHLSDIADVDISNVEDNSILVYKKEADCAQGCEGIDNRWTGYNANENLVTSLQTTMGFDANGAPHTLAAPANANQFYMLGWNAENKLSYSQPVQVVSTEGMKQLYIDPETGQIGYTA